VEALTDRDIKEENKSLSKEEILKRKSFSPNYNDQYYELPPAGRVHLRVKEQAVDRALFSELGKKQRGRTSCRLAPSGCSGSGTKGGL